MKIIINTAHQRFGGGVQVALSFINECRKFPEHEYHVWIGPGIQKSLDKEAFPDNFQFYEFDFGVLSLIKTKTIQKELSTVDEKIKPDVMIATTGPTYYRSSCPQVIGFNLPLYIYPESPYIRDLTLKKKVKLWLKKQAHFYFFKRDAVAFLAQTEDVNRRVRKAFKTDEVHTVTNTCSHYYRNPKAFLDKLPEKPDCLFRFLTLSSFYSHKNLDLIPEVMDELRKRRVGSVEFVLTLKRDDFENNIGEMDGIINVGPVRQEECPSLYAECDGMFLPTLAECFSASYPEAMIMEKPIVTTGLGFARSICGEAALYFEAKSAVAAADEIEKLIGNKELQKRLIANGKKQLKTFDTPEERARRYLEICKLYVK